MMADSARRVFISYSHADAVFANAFAGTLSTFGLNVWKDDKDIPIGDNILKSVYEGIRTSSHFCCILSGSSITSTWVEEELSFAKVRQLSDKRLKIVPVLIDAVVIPDYLQAYLCAHLEDRELTVNSPEFLRILKAFGTDLTEHRKQMLIGPGRIRLLDACQEVRARLVPFRELLTNYRRAEDAVSGARTNRGYDRPRKLAGRVRATTYGADYLIAKAEQNAAGILDSLKHFAIDLGESIERLQDVWDQVDPNRDVVRLFATLRDVTGAIDITRTISRAEDRSDSSWWVQDKLERWLGALPRVEGSVEGAIALLKGWAAFDPEKAAP